MVKPFCEKLIVTIAERAASEKLSNSGSAGKPLSPEVVALKVKILKKIETYNVKRLNSHAANGKLKKAQEDVIKSGEYVLLEWCNSGTLLPVLSWRHEGNNDDFAMAISITLWSLDGNAVGMRFEIGKPDDKEMNPHHYWHCQFYDISETSNTPTKKHVMGRNCRAFISYPAIPLPATNSAGMLLSAMLAVYGRKQLQEIIDSDSSLKQNISAIISSQSIRTVAELFPKLVKP